MRFKKYNDTTVGSTIDAIIYENGLYGANASSMSPSSSSSCSSIYSIFTDNSTSEIFLKMGASGAEMANGQHIVFIRMYGIELQLDFDSVNKEYKAIDQDMSSLIYSGLGLGAELYISVLDEDAILYDMSSIGVSDDVVLNEASTGHILDGRMKSQNAISLTNTGASISVDIPLVYTANIFKALSSTYDGCSGGGLVGDRLTIPAGCGGKYLRFETSISDDGPFYEIEYTYKHISGERPVFKSYFADINVAIAPYTPVDGVNRMMVQLRSSPKKEAILFTETPSSTVVGDFTKIAVKKVVFKSYFLTILSVDNNVIEERIDDATAITIAKDFRLAVVSDSPLPVSVVNMMKASPIFAIGEIKKLSGIVKLYSAFGSLVLGQSIYDISSSLEPLEEIDNPTFNNGGVGWVPHSTGTVIEDKGGYVQISAPVDASVRNDGVRLKKGNLYFFKLSFDMLDYTSFDIWDGTTPAELYKGTSGNSIEFYIEAKNDINQLRVYFRGGTKNPSYANLRLFSVKHIVADSINGYTGGVREIQHNTSGNMQSLMTQFDDYGRVSKDIDNGSINVSNMDDGGIDTGLNIPVNGYTIREDVFGNIKKFTSKGIFTGDVIEKAESRVLAVSQFENTTDGTVVPSKFDLSLLPGVRFSKLNGKQVINVRAEPFFNESDASNIIYVAETGSDTNSGTESSPLRSIKKAFEMSTGLFNLIKVKTGSYPGVYGFDDLKIGNIIVSLIGYGGTVTIQADGSQEYGVDIRSGSYFYAEGIVFKSGRNTLRGYGVNSSIVCKDCIFDGSLYTNNISIISPMLVIFENCQSNNSFRDGFNYHNSQDPDNIGLAIEINCSTYNNGDAPGGSDNGSTAHENWQVIRVDGHYGTSLGPAVADVNYAISLNVGCYASCESGQANYITDYGGTGEAMWLVDCESAGANSKDMQTSNGDKSIVTNGNFIAGGGVPPTYTAPTYDATKGMLFSLEYYIDGVKQNYAISPPKAGDRIIIGRVPVIGSKDIIKKVTNKFIVSLGYNVQELINK